MVVTQSQVFFFFILLVLLDLELTVYHLVENNTGTQLIHIGVSVVCENIVWYNSLKLFVLG